VEGLVKWFDDVKGYGFIELDGYNDIFVHFTSIIDPGHRTLVTGEKVLFDLVTTDKGLRAKNVRSINNFI
jgi:CspA family cold shock protein